jgi:hypothetical protein
MPPRVYHITKLPNLPGIALTGHLDAKNLLQQRSAAHASIAYENIQDRRARHPVPCYPGGVLHDYVPFYFAPRSPMLYTISRGNVPGCPEGQRPVVHLTVDVEAIVHVGLPYVFTDGHAVMAFSGFFTDLGDLDKIDWTIMHSRYWNDTPEYPDRKRRRQAEFLVHQSMPWELVTEIGVIDNSVKDEVEAALRGAPHVPDVVIHRDWYY